MGMDTAPCDIICITGVISYTVMITPGRDHSTLRDHPAFSRNLSHRSLLPAEGPDLDLPFSAVPRRRACRMHGLSD